MKFVKTNHKGWKKDEESRVVINTDMEEYEKILEKRKHDREVNSLKDEINQLKEMVKEILNGQRS
jgi:hypothetical protein